MLMKMPPLWGHSGSTGSFLYYSEDLNLYMTGSKPYSIEVQTVRVVD
jgi:hypothetical protein